MNDNLDKDTNVQAKGGFNHFCCKQIAPFTLLLSFVLVILCLSVCGVLNMTGFCWAQKRWLSDKEKIYAVINYQIKRKILPITEESNGKFVTRSYTQVPYESLDDFLKLNPNCCEQKPLPPKSRGIMRGYASDVRIDYIVRYVDRGGTKRKSNLMIYNSVTNCGIISEI